MGDSEGYYQGTGCTGYDRLVNCEYESDTRLGTLSRSLIARQGNSRGRLSILLKGHASSKLP